MKVKIVSDGQPGGTKVLTDDGQDISSCVGGVIWRHRAGEVPEAELELVLIPFEGVASAKVIAPNGKAVRRIEYEDGTIDEFPEE